MWFWYDDYVIIQVKIIIVLSICRMSYATANHSPSLQDMIYSAHTIIQTKLDPFQIW